LVEAGLEYEVVPGISSSFAVPTYAGIPVTKRDISSSLHIFYSQEVVVEILVLISTLLPL